MKIEWLIANVTVVAFPATVESERFWVILNVFNFDLGRFCNLGALCDLETPSRTLKTLLRVI